MDYITCNRKKSKPKIRVDVCVKCTRMRRCLDYGSYIQPLLFPGLKKIKIRRKTRAMFGRRIDIPMGEEQMELRFDRGKSGKEGGMTEKS
jgi:hypothetical protein